MTTQPLTPPLPNVAGRVGLLVDKKTPLHFLLNNGELAVSGPVALINNFIVLDISEIDPTHSRDIDPAADTVAIAFVDGERWTFKIGHIGVIVLEGKTYLRAGIPTELDILPARKSARSDLESGKAYLRFSTHFEQFELANLSDGGCAYYASAQQAKLWPPGTDMDCEVLSRDTILIKTSLRIIRIQYDFANHQGKEATISCKFSDSGAGKFIEALLRTFAQPL